MSLFRNFVEWTEGDISRGRKVVLLSTIGVYLVLMVTVVISGLIWPALITPNMIQIFGIVTSLMFGIYGFYTGTSSDKTKKLADKAADILLKKMGKLEK